MSAYKVDPNGPLDIARHEAAHAVAMILVGLPFAEVRIESISTGQVVSDASFEYAKAARGSITALFAPAALYGQPLSRLRRRNTADYREAVRLAAESGLRQETVFRDSYKRALELVNGAQRAIDALETELRRSRVIAYARAREIVQQATDLQGSGE